MEKNTQDSQFTQEEKLGVRQGPLGDSRALPFSITYDPPGVVCGSKFLLVQKYFVLVQLWTIAKAENCVGYSFISAMNLTCWFYIGL